VVDVLFGDRHSEWPVHVIEDQIAAPFWIARGIADHDVHASIMGDRSASILLRVELTDVVGVEPRREIPIPQPGAIRRIKVDSRGLQKGDIGGRDVDERWSASRRITLDQGAFGSTRSSRIETVVHDLLRPEGLDHVRDLDFVPVDRGREAPERRNNAANGKGFADLRLQVRIAAGDGVRVDVRSRLRVVDDANATLRTCKQLEQVRCTDVARQVGTQKQFMDRLPEKPELPGLYRPGRRIVGYAASAIDAEFLEAGRVLQDRDRDFAIGLLDVDAALGSTDIRQPVEQRAGRNAAKACKEGIAFSRCVEQRRIRIRRQIELLLAPFRADREVDRTSRHVEQAAAQVCLNSILLDLRPVARRPGHIVITRRTRLADVAKERVDRRAARKPAVERGIAQSKDAASGSPVDQHHVSRSIELLVFIETSVIHVVGRTAVRIIYVPVQRLEFAI